MKLRIARHTNDFIAIQHFYIGLLGLDYLGEFKDHSGYDGVFIGLKNADWHLEFTMSANKPEHHPDDDDLLVFYIETEHKMNEILAKLAANKVKETKAKNPYWNIHGKTFVDPDGYRVVLAPQKLKK